MKNNWGVKKLGDFAHYDVPAGWSRKCLSEIFVLSAGGDVDKNKFSKIKDIRHQYPIYANALTNNGLYGYSSDYVVKSEAITISGRGDIGKVFFRSGKFTPIVRLITAIPKQNISAKFMSYACSRINFYNEMTGVPQLTIPQVSYFKVSYPSIKEQKAIVKVLETWDRGIEITQKLIEQKELQKKYLMQQLLTGKKRLKGFKGKWKKLRFDNVFNDYTMKNNMSQELLSATQEFGVIPRSMLKGRVMSPSGSLKNYKFVKKDSFIISLRSFQGGIEYSKYEGIISPAYTVLKNICNINKSFYRYFFKLYIFIEEYLRIAVIGIRDGKQISYPDLKSIKIPFPEVAEQTAIAEILSTADKEVEILKNKLEKLKEQKKGLMQKLLTGKIRLRI
ncbi:MAG: restriction endonuclease subunit S [Endomicrobium sp.]|jgi:type I restriction enzyme S subunit|nr:restriction endonuclease subunit S [Endomicrobium sp.]